MLMSTTPGEEAGISYLGKLSIVSILRYSRDPAGEEDTSA
jgi:hypothetical protein